MSSAIGPEPRPDRQNGLVAASYSWLRQIDIEDAENLLRAMQEANIACYTAVPAQDADRLRDVFVDEGKKIDASVVALSAPDASASRRITLNADEVDERFAELVGLLDGPSQVPDAPEPPQQPQPRVEDAPSGTPHPDEPTDGWRRGETDWISALDAEQEEGYEPPPPEPVPRPTSRVVGGILLMIAGCIALFSPTVLPIAVTASVVLGVTLLGAGLGWLLMQLGDRPEDPFDDGARV